MTDLIRAFILGIVEGATEFVPVSSTGHLILVGHLIGFTGERAALFEIVIQLGAILAVVWQYRKALIMWTLQARRADQGGGPGARRLLVGLILAFLPAAVVGLLSHRWITAHLFSPLVVACALIAGGIAMLVIERKRPAASVHEVTTIPPRVAIGIGFAQVLSLIPGVSRSAATIMGAIALGVDRPVAAEFSFLLAIPVMFAATGLGALESASLLHQGDALIFAVGFVTAFMSALVALRLLLRFVSTHSFVGFAWYRIVLGAIMLVVLRGSIGA